MITRSPFPPVALTAETITERVLRGLAGRGEATVLIDGPTGAEWTATALETAIRRLAGGLQARGFGPGGVLAILAPNCPEYAVVYHGALLAGGTVTTLNPSYTAPEIAHQLRDSGAAWLVTVPALLTTAETAAEGLTLQTALIGGTLDDWMGAPLMAQVTVDVVRDIAVLPYSSGTTGLPKGVMLSHRNLVANVDQSLAVIGADPGEWTVAFLPFFHIYGQQVLMNMFLAAGGGQITLPRFDLALFLTLVARHRTDTLFCAPPVAIALAKHPLVAEHDLTCVRRIFSAAAPLGGDVADAVGARLGARAVQGYGMSEMAPVSHAMPRGQHRSGSVGLTLPGTECRIVDPATGTDAPEGELWVRGPQVMLGYLNRAEATAATLTPDGWLRTGDLARFDADGFLFILDRVKELIKVSGFQVPPAEVEAALLAHPGVADAAVAGRPDDEKGEVPVAFVVRPPGGTVTGDEIMDHLATRLARYKLPREIRFVDAIPKSPSGKILRRVLPA